MIKSTVLRISVRPKQHSKVLKKNSAPQHRPLVSQSLLDFQFAELNEYISSSVEQPVQYEPIFEAVDDASAQYFCKSPEVSISPSAVELILLNVKFSKD